MIVGARDQLVAVGGNHDQCQNARFDLEVNQRFKQPGPRLEDLMCRIDAGSYGAGLEQRTLDLIDAFTATT